MFNSSEPKETMIKCVLYCRPKGAKTVWWLYSKIPSWVDAILFTFPSVISFSLSPHSSPFHCSLIHYPYRYLEHFYLSNRSVDIKQFFISSHHLFLNYGWILKLCINFNMNFFILFYKLFQRCFLSLFTLSFIVCHRNVYL